tara:strand:- start:114 stop:314 length:201 start_codon:yes stop_codon:yes gene_type:complete
MELTSEQFHSMLGTIRRNGQGGSFAVKLADCLAAADPSNRQRLLDAFPEIIERYGPESIFNRQMAT